MSQSLSKLYVHIVYHVKCTSVYMRKQERQELYAYSAAIIKDTGSIPLIINGVHDHIHILSVLSKNIALAKLVEEVKRNSSRWIKTKDKYYKDFAWQGGYGAFSISESDISVKKRYIANQEEHHRKKSFREEYLVFLKEYGIEYDEKYLWND